MSFETNKKQNLGRKFELFTGSAFITWKIETYNWHRQFL